MPLFERKEETPLLFSPLKVAELELKNRLVVSPMCMYSAHNGVANTFHLVHYGALALGGPGLIFTEAVAVTPEGRISPDDLGLWNDEQKDALARVVDFAHAQETPMGIQLAHAGRKGSTYAPQRGRGGIQPEEGGWPVMAPSALAYAAQYLPPREMSFEDITQVTQAFGAAARRAMLAGFDALEIHAAHGYLLHEFLSPLSNKRTDIYGGTLENRARFLLEVIETVQQQWPGHLPLFVRLSATDWVEGGWDIEQTVALCKLLKRAGVQVIDVSSGGLSPAQNITVGPGYQVPFAATIRQETDLQVMTVGMITSGAQAEAILQQKEADLIAVGRAMLRNPRFAYAAAQELGVELPYPAPYERAK